MNESLGQNLKRMVVITGASKGIGEEIAYQCNKKFAQNTLFVLLARNDEKLERLRNRLSEQNQNKSNVYLNVLIDFSNSKHQLVDYIIKLKDSIDHLNVQQMNEIFVFYNHGTLLISCVEECAFNINEYFETNVLSVWKLLSAIRTLFPIEMVPKQYHINMSTKSADHFHPLLAAFSSSKFIFKKKNLKKIFKFQIMLQQDVRVQLFLIVLR